MSQNKSILSWIFTFAGIKFAPEWTAEEYKAFLESMGWKITKSEVIKGRIDLLYTECSRSS